jgi:xanthine dehydrogenase accessory factor
MSDLKRIVSAAHALRAQDEERPLLLATVVNVAGSASRRIGARMLIAEDRWVCGSVTGNCPSGDVIRKAWWFTRDGAPALLSYVSKGDELDWAIGLEPNGLVDLLLEPCDIDDPYDPVAFLESCLTAQKPGVVATILRPGSRRVAVGARLQLGPDGTIRSTIADARLADALASRARAALEAGRSEVYAEGGVEALLEAVIPPPHIYLFGAGPDAVPLASMAAQLGWLVTVSDASGHPWTPTWFPGADEVRSDSALEIAAAIGQEGRSGFAVVWSHDYGNDRQILGALLQSGVRYIGIPGSRGRAQRMLAELAAGSDRRVHAPTELEASRDNPAEVAVAIIAEIQAIMNGPAPGNPDDLLAAIPERRAYPRVEPVRTAG